MKKVLLGISFALLTGIVILAIMGSKMQEIKTEIHIDAKAEKVWEVLMDFDKWQDWSPIIKQSKGSAQVGSQLQMTMVGKSEGESGPSYKPKIEEMSKPHFFRWRAHMMASFIMTNDKVFELTETENGTKLVHKELFKGLMAPIFCGQMEKGVPPMLNKFNQALKALVEKK